MASTTFFESRQGSFLEVPVATLVLDQLELQTLIGSLNKIATPMAINQSIQILYPNKMIKQKSITHDDKPVTIECMFESVFIKSFRDGDAHIIKRKLVECINGAPKEIKLSHKLIASYNDHPEWLVAVSLNKSINNPMEFTTRLVEYKEALLQKVTLQAPMGDIPFSAYDSISVSLEFIGDALTKTQINSINMDKVKSILPKNSSDDPYQQMLYLIAKEVFRDPKRSERFKEKSGFKFLTPSAIELSRPIYFKEVLPIIDTFYITDKIDGMRIILRICEYYKRSGQKRTLLGTSIMAISNDIIEIQSYQAPKGKNIEVQQTILDGEMLDTKKTKEFHIFDVIMIKNKRVANVPFKVRIKEFPQVDSLMTRLGIGQTKEFVKLTKDGYKEQLNAFYSKAKARDYEIDGIIFTPEGKSFRELPKREYVKFNTEYFNTVSYKWKPVEQSTIDFYLMKVEGDAAKRLRKQAGLDVNSKEHTYALCSGVDNISFKKLNLQFFDGYVAPVSENSFQYFPIQFSPFDKPYMFIWSSPKADLGGRVAEFKFLNKDQTFLETPQIIRMRDDRTNDIRKGEYFGNALKYSELIWHSIKHPLTFEMLGLSSDQLGGYFAVNSDNDYFAQRAFNSFIKGELMKEYLSPPSIVDLMCGKGQDMARSIDMGFTQITMIDRDIDALYELLHRKYNLRLKTPDASASIHIRQVDFEQSYEDIIASTDLPSKVSSVMLNFGIHYLAHDKTENNKNLPLNGLFKLVASMLEVGGRFLITCFDGQTVFNLLQGKQEWNTEDNKYSIKKAFTSNEFAKLNQAIDVKLPFSGSAYYREFLVNVSFLEELASKNGFKLLINNSFSSYFDHFKQHNNKIYKQMTPSDKEWTSIYSYIVFERIE